MTTPTPPVIQAQIQTIAWERFPWAGEPTPDADLRADLDLDSLHLVELQVAVEDHFGVAFDPFDEQLIEAFRSVKHLATYVEYLLSGEKTC